MPTRETLTIARRFDASSIAAQPLGNGLINDTFLIETNNEPFVLQRVNRLVFSQPEQIADNLLTLQAHLAQQTAAQLQCPQLLPTLDGQQQHRDAQGDYWRALSFIAGSESLETPRSLHDLEQVGFALGHFHRLLSVLDTTRLHDTLPDFHITPRYFQHYQHIRQHTTIAEHDYCAAFIQQQQTIINDLEDAKQRGLLPLRVIHGDPKLNNFLFSRLSGQVISLIDLDTVKAGLVHYDIGDCLRSCCQTDKAEFSLERCAAVLRPYLQEAAAFFTAHDYTYLYAAMRLIPFELGLRFYTDYLHGNCYFKVTAPEQNLHRAIHQFRLCESIMAQQTAITDLLTHLQATAC